MNPSTIKAGDVVRIKPEWQDKGDGAFVWIAVSDEHPAQEWAPGRVKPANVDISHLPLSISAVEAQAMSNEQRLAARLMLSPWHSVDVSMLETVE